MKGKQGFSGTEYLELQNILYLWFLDNIELPFRTHAIPSLCSAVWLQPALDCPALGSFQNILRGNELAMGSYGNQKRATTLKRN